VEDITCPPTQSGARVVVRQQAATLVQSGVSTMEETRSLRKRGAADQLIRTRKAAKTMQGPTFEHVDRKPKKSRILWAEPVSVEFVTCPTRGVFKGIDGVESILGNKYLRIDPLAQYDIRSDNKDSSNESNHQAKHGTNFSQRAFPANLIDIIRAIREEAIPAPTAPEFMFKLTSEAAERNFMILKKYNFDLAMAIEAQKSSPQGYGSQFQSPKTLQKIFASHPLWQRMEHLLIEGLKWPLTELSKRDRIEDLNEALQVGNHKGALQKPKLLKKLISNNIKFGYGLVVPRGKIAWLPNACLAPMSIMNQFTLNASSKIVDKERLTHDQSFKWQSGLSVNKRVIRENLQ
jgi:hypothetical protein